MLHSGDRVLVLIGRIARKDHIRNRGVLVLKPRGAVIFVQTWLRENRHIP